MYLSLSLSLSLSLYLLLSLFVVLVRSSLLITLIKCLKGHKEHSVCQKVKGPCRSVWTAKKCFASNNSVKSSKVALAMVEM